MKILCIHQGYELYGSDRSFIQSIRAMREAWPHAQITACLPQNGAIVAPLEDFADTIIFEKLWVPRKNALLRLFTVDALRFPQSVTHAIQRMRKYDIVYINTMTILNYNVAARFAGVHSIIHVREIVGAKASAVFSAILRFSNASIVFNSKATERAFRLRKCQKRRVIYNGIADINEIAPPQPEGKLKLLMLGRFNSWKGQDLLVDAIALLDENEKQNIEVHIAGGVFEGQQHFVEAIERQINQANLSHTIKILPFSDDTESMFAWSDIVIVPSKKPEPFGRVATEAMGNSRPVIAADHGGLSEIVKDAETGWLFEPNNASDCAHIISHLLCHTEEVVRAGKNARARFEEYFSETNYDRAIIDICQKKRTFPMHNKTVKILGIRGVPASHGGFETFADYFSRYLVKNGWNVVVYCQEEGKGNIYETEWEGVRRVHIPVKQSGSKGSIIFDGLANRHASKEPGIALTLGYNTAFFGILLRLAGVPNLINMDGIEWKRSKWSKPVQLWFWANEHIACHIANHLIADHPEMKKHLQRNVPESKITVSAYGADSITSADESIIAKFDVQPYQYATLIARPEPENSVLEAVKAFSARKRNITLVVLGKYSTEDAYQKSVMDAASDEVKFVGAIYEKEVVSALRFYSKFYMHGHTVGGTNPSLIEALGAGNPVIAHNNRFNRWVAQDGARFFDNTEDCDAIITRLLADGNEDELASMAAHSRSRHAAEFEWPKILKEQEQILLRELDKLTESKKGRASSASQKEATSTHSMKSDTNAPHNM